MKREAILAYFESRLPDVADPEVTDIISNVVSNKGLPAVPTANMQGSPMLVPGALPIALLYKLGAGGPAHEKATRDYVDRMIAWQRDGKTTDPVTGAITSAPQVMNGQHATGDVLAWAYAQFGWEDARTELLRECDVILTKEKPGPQQQNQRYYGHLGRMAMLCAMVDGEHSARYLSAIAQLFYFARLQCGTNHSTGLHWITKNYPSYKQADHFYDPCCTWMTGSILNLYRHLQIVFPGAINNDANLVAWYGIMSLRDAYRLGELYEPAIDPVTGEQRRPAWDWDPDFLGTAPHPKTGSTQLGNPNLGGGDAMGPWILPCLLAGDDDDRNQALATYNDYNAMRVGDKGWQSQNYCGIALEMVANGFPWRHL